MSSIWKLRQDINNPKRSVKIKFSMMKETSGEQTQKKLLTMFIAEKCGVDGECAVMVVS